MKKIKKINELRDYVLGNDFKKDSQVVYINSNNEPMLQVDFDEGRDWYVQLSFDKDCAKVFFEDYKNSIFKEIALVDDDFEKIKELKNKPAPKNVYTAEMKSKGIKTPKVLQYKER